MTHLHPRKSRRVPLPTRKLRFTPTAWSKLLWLRDRGETEIGGFGISPPDDLLCVEEVVLVPQQASLGAVVFDDEAVADHFDRQIDAGRSPEQCGRIWIHTHPGHCPLPSPTDEETFQRVFGRCDWAVMLILARNGACSTRLRWNIGPQGVEQLGVGIEYTRPFAGTALDAWAEEYDRCVQTREFMLPGGDDDRRIRRSRRDLAGAGSQTDDEFWGGDELWRGTHENLLAWEELR